jgi:hypothetical protein
MIGFTGRLILPAISSAFGFFPFLKILFLMEGDFVFFVGFLRTKPDKCRNVCGILFVGNQTDILLFVLD